MNDNVTNPTAGMVTWPYGTEYGFGTQPLTTWTGTAQYCLGNVHVWPCDHAETCKCGKASRKHPAPCPSCGK